MPDEKMKSPEGIMDFLPLVVPAILAIVAVYFLFPQYNDSEMRNTINSTNIRIDSLNDSKANLTQFDSNFSKIHANISIHNSTIAFFESKLTSFLSRILEVEENTTSASSSIASISSKVTAQDTAISSLTDGIASLRSRMNQIGNETEDNYGDALDWAATLNTRIDSLNDSMQDAVGRQDLIEANQTILRNRIDALNVTVQKLCLFNSSWC